MREQCVAVWQDPWDPRDFHDRNDPWHSADHMGGNEQNDPDVSWLELGYINMSGCILSHRAGDAEPLSAKSKQIVVKNLEPLVLSETCNELLKRLKTPANAPWLKTPSVNPSVFMLFQ